MGGFPSPHPSPPFGNKSIELIELIEIIELVQLIQLIPPPLWK